MFIKNGDGKIISVIKPEELDEEENNSLSKKIKKAKELKDLERKSDDGDN